MMKSLVALSALALGTVAVAHATPISGTLSIGGDDTYTTSTITFIDAAIGGGPGANTGTFSFLTNGNSVTMFPAFAGALPYSMGQNTVPAAISPVELETTTEGGITVDFFMTDYNAMLVSGVTGCTTGTCLDVTGNGYFTETGYTNSPGSFTFTSQLEPGQTSTTFSASALASPIPEPDTLALVGTGLLGFVGFARRRLNA
jgi:hypothetical protein